MGQLDSRQARYATQQMQIRKCNKSPAVAGPDVDTTSERDRDIQREIALLWSPPRVLTTTTSTVAPSAAPFKGVLHSLCRPLSCCKTALARPPTTSTVFLHHSRPSTSSIHLSILLLPPGACGRSIGHPPHAVCRLPDDLKRNSSRLRAWI